MSPADDGSFWEGRPVALTGATGFLGRHLAARLLDLGADVRALVRSPTKAEGLSRAGVACVPGALDEPDSLARAFAGRDVVFHLAGAVDFGADAARIERVNVGGTAAVLEAVRGCGVRRLVHVSSVVAVGAAREPVELDEEAAWDLGRYRLPYVTTKRAAERLVLSRRDVDAVVVNPSCVIGPDDFGPSEFGDLCKRFWRGRIPFTFAGGSNFVDVRDVASGLLSAARRGAVWQRYLLTGENLRYGDFFAALARTAGWHFRGVPLPCGVARMLGWLEGKTSRGRPYLGQAPLLGLYFFFRATKARRELGYQARPLAETLRDAHAFWFPQAAEVRHAA